MPGQLRKREAERAARHAAVEVAEGMRSAGVSATLVATAFEVSTRTLLRWSTEARARSLELRPHGRPAKRASRSARSAVLHQLATHPRLGVPALRACHPDLGHREIEELAARFRSVRTARNRDWIHALTWHLPGSVWAIDFSCAGVQIEGTYPDLLLVRDLATGYTLLSLPCSSQDAGVVCVALSTLFSQEGAPFVLKADNGGSFVADATAALLEANEVVLLRSPPWTPSYNGACEAGVGSIKTRAHHIAAARGREACWSCDDLEAARVEANEICRARAGAPTAGEQWRARAPLCPQLRADLRADVAARVARGLAELEGVVEDRARQQVVREAIAGSLRARSLLSIRISPSPPAAVRVRPIGWWVHRRR